MSILMTADLHLTSDPADGYRFGVFNFLHGVIDKEEPDALLILGDLTDKKDRHDATLVNEIVDELASLAEKCEVWVLKGNHDYIDENNPFFKFLHGLTNVHFITETGPIEVTGYDVLALPHTRHWRSQWQAILTPDYDFAITHQAIRGCKVANGADVGDVPLELYEHLECPVFAGDIHVPQRLGPVRYCGAPHPVTFGDTFTPRVLLYNGEKIRSIKNTSTIQKHQIEVENAEQLKSCVLLEVRSGDQVKVKVALKAEDIGRWDEVRDECLTLLRDCGVHVRGLEMVRRPRRRRLSKASSGPVADPLQVFEKFCEATEMDESEVATGRQIVETVNDD